MAQQTETLMKFWKDLRCPSCGNPMDNPNLEDISSDLIVDTPKVYEEIGELDPELRGKGYVATDDNSYLALPVASCICGVTIHVVA